MITNLILKRKSDKCNKKYNLHSTQKSIWITQKLNKESSLFNIGGYSRYSGSLNIDIFRETLEEIINEQDSLCMEFFEEDGIAFQKVSERVEYTISYCDDYKSKEEVLKYIEEDMKKVISLEDNQLFKIVLFKTAENEHYAFFKAHHIISDGYSISVLVNRIIDIYNNKLNKKEDTFRLQHSYVDLIEDEIKYKNSDKYKIDEKYWVDKLDVERHLAFENCKQNSGSLDESIKRVSTNLSRSEFEKISAFCKENKSSIFHYFVATLYMTNRMYNNESFVLGMPILNRTFKESNKIFGAFISVKPFFMEDSKCNNFRELLTMARDSILSSYKHLKYPLYDLSEKLENSGLLYNICFSYQQTRYPKNMADIEVETTYVNQGEQQEDLVVHIVENIDEAESDISIYMDYKENLFKEEVVKNIINRFSKLLSEVYKTPDKLISEYSIVTKDEENKILSTFNDTQVDFPQDKCIHEFFEEKVLEKPNNIAVRYNDVTLTYEELNSRANKLAVYLQKNGIKVNTLVGICMERSIEMVLSIIAIYKAGGAYVPIDPEYPDERLKYMVEDSQISIVLTQTKFINKFKNKNINIINLNTQWDLINKEKEEDRIKDVKPDNWAYMIYTSGSTGRPKGVINTHKALVNRIVWMQKELKMTEKDVVLQKTPFSFDVSVWEFVWPLMIGARIVMAEPGGHRDPEYLVDTIKKEKVTTIHFVPSMLRIFIDSERSKECTSLKRIVCSGEELKADLKDKCLGKLNADLYNLYGPTESAIDVSYWRCNDAPDMKVVPFGKPIDNVELYVLNKDLNILPVGVAGELYISGAGLAVGYYNKKELTDERFISNPYSRQGYKRMYKTGDLARWMDDGNIEYLGRVDFQVKINGLRIELGEIEYQIGLLDEINEAKVIAHTDKRGNKCLVAYYTRDAHTIEYTTKCLKNMLKDKLPAYMVPSIFVYMDKLPLSPNGKLDRKKLPELNEVIEERQCVKPETKEEEMLVNLFKETLEIDNIGTTDDFFDLGGTSLKAIQLVSKYKEITIQDLYKYPTVKDIIYYVHNVKKENTSCLVKLKDGKENRETLVCIPFGGGMPTIYNDLAASIKNDNLSVYAVSLAGHNYGMFEEDLKSVKEMAMIIVKDITKEIKGNIILYGHCVGCALTYEVAKQLAQRGIEVKHVFMAASFPFFLNTIKGKLSKKLIDYYYSNDERTLKFLKKLGGFKEDINNETIKYILKWFRHDGNEAMNYFEKLKNSKNKYKVNSMSVIVGTADPITKYFNKEVEHWSELAIDINIVKISKGRHYFVQENVDELSEIINSELERFESLFEKRHKDESIVG